METQDVETIQRPPSANLYPAPVDVSQAELDRFHVFERAAETVWKVYWFVKQYGPVTRQQIAENQSINDALVHKYLSWLQSKGVVEATSKEKRAMRFVWSGDDSGLNNTFKADPGPHLSAAEKYLLDAFPQGQWLDRVALQRHTGFSAEKTKRIVHGLKVRGALARREQLRGNPLYALAGTPLEMVPAYEKIISFLCDNPWSKLDLISKHLVIPESIIKRAVKRLRDSGEVVAYRMGAFYFALAGESLPSANIPKVKPIIEYLRLHGHAKRPALAGVTLASYPTLTRIINQLIIEGILRVEAKGRQRVYKLAVNDGRRYPSLHGSDVMQLIPHEGTIPLDSIHLPNRSGKAAETVQHLAEMVAAGHLTLVQRCPAIIARANQSAPHGQNHPVPRNAA